MARQATTPVEFARSVRPDTATTMSSGRAGKVVPVGFVPLFAGDTCSGKVGIDVRLAEMPRPLRNGVTANFQAWFVPKSAHPQFPGRDELIASMTGTTIRALGQEDRAPADYFSEITVGAEELESEIFTTLGLHFQEGDKINSDLLDAFAVLYNFRLASHSDRLFKENRRKYYGEADPSGSAYELPRAFWPSAHFAKVVPDYERALIVGALDLDVLAGRLPVSGIGFPDAATVSDTDIYARETGKGQKTKFDKWTTHSPYYRMLQSGAAHIPAIYAEMKGQSVGVTLADMDKARTAQAFAKLRTAYRGNDSTGYTNDDAIVSLLMQGISVPADQFKRPWLLDSKRVPIGFAERFATDAANLDSSVTLGAASAVLSLNVPMQDVGGMIVFTVEVLPERLHERMSDEFLYATSVSDLPNALRDIQRVEPVDLVMNRRVDARHVQPNGLYGYEPMNNVWNRDFTRLGGDFYQATPAAGFSETRSNIWQTEIVNPAFGTSHYLAPVDFPHDVFADTLGDAYEFTCRHMLTISGITQIGDVLAENNDDYDAIGESGL